MRLFREFPTIAFGLGLGLMALLVSTQAALAQESHIGVIQHRGTLLCGTDNATPGFGYLNPKTGRMEGVDVDFCRAVAAAVLGDPTKVTFVNVTDKNRFNALQTGQIDVLFAHTTLTVMRAASVGASFTPIYFYDGTGAMVKTSSGIKHVDQLNGATICTTQGSSTEVDWSAWITAHHWSAATKVLTYQNTAKLYEAFNAGRCDAMSTDKSALVGYRGNSGNPASLTILPETIEKSPFAGATPDTDPKWSIAVSSVVEATIEAEEYGVTTANLSASLTSADSKILDFLGITGAVGTNFGLPNNFVQKIIAAVGNYGEIYNRNLGPATPWSLARQGSNNAEYTDGGLIFSPPWS